jgi:hypothetical protein
VVEQDVPGPHRREDVGFLLLEAARQGGEEPRQVVAVGVQPPG